MGCLVGGVGWRMGLTSHEKLGVGVVVYEEFEAGAGFGEGVDVGG